MRSCRVCEGTLPLSYFRGESDVCKLCTKKAREGGTRYERERKSALQAHLDLVGAIRRQAVTDGALDSWEDYWLSEPWKTIWDVLRDGH